MSDDMPELTEQERVEMASSNADLNRLLDLWASRDTGDQPDYERVLDLTKMPDAERIECHDIIVRKVFTTMTAYMIQVWNIS